MTDPAFAAEDDAVEVPAEAAEAVVEAGRRMDLRNWVPATSGNLSVRLDAHSLAITRSGVHKGRLEAEDVIPVDLDGRMLAEWGRLSVETPLHCQIYRLFPEAGAVLHGHSVAGTVLSMLPGPGLALAGYEVMKAFGGQPGHEGRLVVPVVENEQDVARLAATLAPILPAARAGYLVRGHGTYVWGADMDTAFARLEALEFLLECELARRRLNGTSQ